MNSFNEKLKLLIYEINQFDVEDVEKIYKVAKYHADRFDKNCKYKGIPLEKDDILLVLYESMIKAKKYWKPGKCQISTYISKILLNKILNIYRKYNREMINKSKNRFNQRYYSILESQCVWANENEIQKKLCFEQFLESQPKNDQIIYEKLMEGYSRKQIYEDKINTRKKVYFCWEKLTFFLRNNLI